MERVGVFKQLVAVFGFNPQEMLSVGGVSVEREQQRMLNDVETKGLVVGVVRIVFEVTLGLSVLFAVCAQHGRNDVELGLVDTQFGQYLPLHAAQTDGLGIVYGLGAVVAQLGEVEQ